MRFLRQLAAVMAVVTVVVLIGLAWHHFAPDSFGGQGGPGPHRFVRGEAAVIAAVVIVDAGLRKRRRARRG